MPATAHAPLDVLFLSEKPLWPLDQGFKVHGYHTAVAAAALGARVGVACLEPLPGEAPGVLRDLMIDWPAATPEDTESFAAGWGGARRGPIFHFRRRLASHQGMEPARLGGAVALMERYRPRAVVGVGMHSMLMLAGLGPAAARCGASRVWFAADELIYFNLSCLFRQGPGAVPGRLRSLALHAALEVCFARGLEGAIGVSPRDARLLHTLAGARRTITLRNGVDLDYFQPSADEAADAYASRWHSVPLAASCQCPGRAPYDDLQGFDGPRHWQQAASGTASSDSTPHSLAFWGRLDFEPNVDAVCWFGHRVWPRLRALNPDATWQIAGKNPAPSVRALGGLPGVEVLGEVADVRPVAHGAALVILPMRCGGGIKNKLLEAAAMGRPIVASPRAVAGLEPPADAPAWRTCRRAADWVETIDQLWRFPAAAGQLGRSARHWVEARHRWSGVATRLLAWVDSGLATGIPARRGGWWRRWGSATALGGADAAGGFEVRLGVGGDAPARVVH